MPELRESEQYEIGRKLASSEDVLPRDASAYMLKGYAAYLGLSPEQYVSVRDKLASFALHCRVTIASAEGFERADGFSDSAAIRYVCDSQNPYDSASAVESFLYAEMSAYDQGVAMGKRHAATGDVSDFSDDRCTPLETEKRTTAKRLDPRKPFGSADFLRGYDEGYETTMRAAELAEDDESDPCDCGTVFGAQGFYLEHAPNAHPDCTFDEGETADWTSVLTAADVGATATDDEIVAARLALESADESSRQRRHERARLYGRTATDDKLDRAQAAYVVVDLESATPTIVGTYLATDEDAIRYMRSDGSIAYAPIDCVRVMFEEDARRLISH